MAYPQVQAEPAGLAEQEFVEPQANKDAMYRRTGTSPILPHNSNEKAFTKRPNDARCATSFLVIPFSANNFASLRKGAKFVCVVAFIYYCLSQRFAYRGSGAGDVTTTDDSGTGGVPGETGGHLGGTGQGLVRLLGPPSVRGGGAHRAPPIPNLREALLRREIFAALRRHVRGVPIRGPRRAADAASSHATAGASRFRNAAPGLSPDQQTDFQ